MESLCLFPLLILLSIFGFDSTAGKLQIFSGGNRLILWSSKCKKCMLLPYKNHKELDPSNTRISKSYDEMKAMLKKCKEVTVFTDEGLNFVAKFYKRTSKWCGLNNDKAVTKCCDERSKCPLKLEGWQSNGKSKNIRPFTINGCDCEDKFVECLKEVNNNEAKKVYNFIFHTFPGACLTFDHPIVCNHSKTNRKTNQEIKKLECTWDKKRPKRWQVIDLLTGKVEK